MFRAAVMQAEEATTLYKPGDDPRLQSLLEHSLFTQHFHLPRSGLWSPLFLLFTHTRDSPLDLHITALFGCVLCCCPLHTGPLGNPPLQSHPNPFTGGEEFLPTQSLASE